MQRRSEGSAASVFVLGLAGLATLAAACGSEPEMDWDPDVVRVVAERNASLIGYPMIVWRRVLDQDVDRAGQAMPWGAHQALITAG